MIDEWGNMAPDYGYGVNVLQQRHTVTRKDILEYIQMNLGTTDITLVDEFETLRTRHICQGTKVIQLLDKTIYIVPTINGPVNVEIIYCPNCRKLLVNKNSIEIL